MKRLSNLLASVGLLIASTLIGFLVFEVIARNFFAEPIQPRFVRDSGFGIRDNQPYVRTRHTSPGEYQVRITTNTAGLRGSRDYTETKPPGVRRVAVLGDSFAFGYGVRDDDVVSAVLERELNSRAGGPRFEVLNFSVSGFGQAEELVLYRNKVRRYAPDEVIIFYFDNDVGNNRVPNLFVVEPDGGVRSTGASYLPGVSVRQWMYKVPGVNWFLQRSFGWNLIRNRLSALAHRYLLRKSNLRTYDEATPEALALTQALLAQFTDDVAHDGARLTVFVIPDVHGNSNFPLSVPDAERLGLRVVDGRGMFVRDDYYFHRDGHWRPPGHRKAALALAPLLLADGR